MFIYLTFKVRVPLSKGSVLLKLLLNALLGAQVFINVCLLWVFMEETFCLLINHKVYPVPTFPLSVKTEGSLTDMLIKTVQCSQLSAPYSLVNKEIWDMQGMCAEEFKLHDAKMHYLSVLPHQLSSWFFTTSVVDTLI